MVETIRRTEIPRTILTRPPTREEERTQAERDIAGRLGRERIPIGPQGKIVSSSTRGRRIREQTPAQQRAEAQRNETLRLQRIEATRLKGIRESARQERISAGRLTGQFDDRQPSVISEFRPFIVPPPTREELVGQPSFISRAREFIGAEARFLFGERRPEEIATGLPKLEVLTGAEKREVQRFTTGTIIDPGSGIRPLQTIAERETEVFIIGRGGVTEQQEADRISRSVTIESQKDLQQEADKLQRQINTGDLSLKEAQGKLKTAETREEKEAEKEFNIRITKTLREKRLALSEFRRLRGERKADIAPFIETAVIIPGLVLAPQVTGTALIARGGLTTFASVSEPKGQRAGVIASGLLDIGIGGSALKPIGTILKEEATTRAFADISRQPFRAGELVDVRFPVSQRGAIALGAGRQLGRVEGARFARQLGTFSLEAIGRRRGFAETIGAIETRARIVPVGLETGFFKPFTRTATQQFRAGQTISIAQLGEGVTAFTGIADVAGRRIPIGGVTQRIGGETFLTRAGEITRAELFPGRGLSLDFRTLDTTIGRTLPALQPATRGFRIISPRRLFGIAPLRGRVTPGVAPPAVDPILRGLARADITGISPQILQPTLRGVSAVTSGLKFAPVSSFRAGLEFLPPAVATSERIAGRLFGRGAVAGTGRLAGPSLVTPSLKQFDTGITLVQPRLSLTLGDGQRTGVTPITSPAFRQPVAVVPKQPQVVAPILDQPQQPRFDFPGTGISPRTQQFTFPAFTPPRGGFDFGFAPFFGLPTLGGKPARKKKKKAKKKKRGRIRPSFTALSLDLRGVLPKGGGRLGITPFQIRAIPL